MEQDKMVRNKYNLNSFCTEEINVCGIFPDLWATDLVAERKYSEASLHTYQNK